jgi:hypothetical protein
MKLNEVKKGQEGYGLLIENDGYVSKDVSENNKKIIKEALDIRESTGEWNVPNPFILDVVLQKHSTLNANGRIYPEGILKREVEKYQELINDRRALGECYTPDVMVLTETGWKSIAEVKEGDRIITLNVDTKEIEIQSVVRKIEKEYEGNLISVEGRNISEKVTPNHGYPVFNRYNKFKDFISAKDLLNSEITDLHHSYIPKQGVWTSKGNDVFVLKGIDSPSKRTLMNHPDCVNDFEIPMDIFMKFMGIYLSEGDYGKKGNDVRIHQVKENVCLMIDELLSQMGLPYKIQVRKSDNKRVFKICDPRLHAYVEKLGDCYTKYIPFELKQQSKENLRCLYDWFVLGDGRIRGDKRRKNKSLSDDVFSASKQLILDLNEIQLKIGYSGNYHVEDRKYDRIIEGREIKGENCHDLHFSLRSLAKGIYLDPRFLKTSEVSYKGVVMCLEVPNHTFYVMSNGKCHWTKNCNHPESSTIDLGRISHNIIECHWEGKTLVGKIEFNLTEGFRKHGICSSLGDTCANLILNGYKIGVSSRAVGSVKTQFGKTVVQDDLELICWDVVATPSTPGSYIGNREDLQMYIENDVSKEHKDTLNEKIDKIKKLLQ